MSDGAATDLRPQLEVERDDLRRQLEELGGLNYDSNFADSSQVTAERGEAEVLVAKLKATLDDVEHAREKPVDSYGLCEACSKPIASARLEAMPAARFCIDCASKR